MGFVRSIAGVDARSSPFGPFAPVTPEVTHPNRPVRRIPLDTVTAAVSGTARSPRGGTVLTLARQRSETAVVQDITAVRPDPEALMARVVTGDEDAFAELYTVLAPSVLGIVTRVLRSRAMSEEVTQEVLVEIWRKASQFSEVRGSVMTWALTIAHRRAIDRVRSEQASVDREERAERLDPRRSFDEVSEAILATVDRERVRRALDELTVLQRESILLAYYQGLTYREVSGVLHVPLATIKTRMRDGLIRLRDALGVTA
jgi:RNA polymerase sigma-70 factor (ECF subfamily)